MKKKKDNYFVSIKADFLFDNVKQFKSRYTPWVYIYLKLEKNYYIDHQLKKSFPINSISISSLLGINRATVHRSINELIQIGLVEKFGRDSYKINSEKKLISGKATFIKIYKNLFINIFDNGGKVDEALIYWYMIQNNRHYAFEHNFLESELTQSRISRELKMGQRKVKASLVKLKNLGLISQDENNILFTKSPKADWNLKYTDKSISKLGRANIDMPQENCILTFKTSEFKNQQKEIQEQNVCFWKKSRDGRTEAPVIKTKYHGYVLDSTRIRYADGIPMTDEEWDLQNEKYRSFNKLNYGNA